jgi:hypothetical protein
MTFTGRVLMQFAADTAAVPDDALPAPHPSTHDELPASGALGDYRWDHDHDRPDRGGQNLTMNFPMPFSG